MVKELSITLNPGPIGGSYCPGSTLSRFLTIQVDKPKHYKTIIVQVEGKASVYWTEGGDENSSPTIYSSGEVYINQQIVLWRSDLSPSGTFPPGRFTYPFQFILPANCPSSFSSDIANITYEIEGGYPQGHSSLITKLNIHS